VANARSKHYQHQFALSLRHRNFIMNSFIIVLIVFLEFTSASFYQESSQDMLSQCNIYQHKVKETTRIKHLCEKPDFEDDFSYFITPMETKYSGRKFLCLSFFKDDQLKLKFKLWFSHSNYTVNAVSQTSC
jgi:hypothetical protein